MCSFSLYGWLSGSGWSLPRSSCMSVCACDQTEGEFNSILGLTLELSNETELGSSSKVAKKNLTCYPGPKSTADGLAFFSARSFAYHSSRAVELNRNQTR